MAELGWLMLALELATRKLRVGVGFLLFAAVLDYLFLRLYGTLIILFVDPASLALSQIVATTGEEVMLSTVVSHPAFVSFLGWLTLQLLCIYLLFNLFEGGACYLTHKALSRKVSYHHYMQRFLKASIPWFLLFTIYQSMALLRDYIALQGTNVGLANIILDFTFVVLVLLAGIHFNIITKNKKLSDVLTKVKKEWKTLLPVAASLVVLTLILDLLIRVWPKEGILSYIPYVLVVVYFAWARGVWLAQ